MEAGWKDETHGLFDIICKPRDRLSSCPARAVHGKSSNFRVTWESNHCLTALRLLSTNLISHSQWKPNTSLPRPPTFPRSGAVSESTQDAGHASDERKSSHQRGQWLTKSSLRCPRRYWQRRPALHPSSRPSPPLHSYRRRSQP
jgi:hypothetical protein